MQQDGFTLVELLLALALLGMLIPHCLQLEATTVGYIQATRLRTGATRLAENLMERELTKPRTVPAQGEDGLYRWQLERIADEVRVLVLWSDRGREHRLEVVTLVAVP